MKCFNLCDLLDRTDFTNGTVKKLALLPEFSEIQRIYFGSYFCSRYFLEIDYINELQQFLRECPKKLTLVIPVASEKDLSDTKRKIKVLLDTLPIDEVTVNDVGMLETIHKNYPVKLNLGRLFFKDARDIRIPQLYREIYRPAELEFLKGYSERYSISAVELDPVSTEIDLRTNCKVQFALHEPYCYLTTGNICKYAAIGKEIQQKFRPNAVCKRQCHSVFEVSTPETKAYSLYRIGRAIYFKAEHPGTINGIFDRYLCFPFHEIVQLRKAGALL